MLFLASFVAYWPPIPTSSLTNTHHDVSSKCVHFVDNVVNLSILNHVFQFIHSTTETDSVQKHFALVEGESTRQSLFFHLIGTFGSRQQLLFQVVSSTAAVKDHQITRFVNRTFCTIKIGIPLALRLLRNDTFFWPFFSTSRPF